MTRKSYPTDLTVGPWVLIEPLIPRAKAGGRPREVDMREVINAILYLTRTGCPWRTIPHDLPPFSTVADDFYRFRNDGTWQKIHDRLGEQVRVAAAKQHTPSAAIIDSQSVKTMEKGGLVATTAARKSQAGNDISSWTPWG